MKLRMKEIRVARNLKQEEVASLAGMPVRRYGSYERGERVISLVDAAIIADVLECSLDELVGREWPRGNVSALTADESSLVGSYRLMDAEQRARYKDLAGTFVIASEKDGASIGVDAGRSAVVAR
ncbi:MAG: helix-turn-helix transcriptional regulator [Eggerthellaceae bacterium]|nr:helix-turn-helix transcriptional regulator [Eggerthellaceae bacterium]